MIGYPDEHPTPEENEAATEYMVLLGKSLERRTSFEEMRSWAARKDAWQRADLHQARLAGHPFSPTDIRAAAVSFKLIDFLDKCVELKAEIATVFRAHAHRQQRGRT